MKKIIFTLIAVLFVSHSFSQGKKIIHLWPSAVPGEIKEKMGPVIDATKRDNVLRLTEVTDPAIEVWLPDPAINNGAALIVCPGGAYRILAFDKEGTEIAGWLNKLGYSAFVLQYRIPDKREGALQDAQRAIRLVRNRAGEWGIDPGKIGIIGFSAGGSLSARASTAFNKRTYAPVDEKDSLSCRPSFTLLIYPAYLDQGPDFTLTPELTISKDVPSMFIFQTADDTYGNSALVMAGALRNLKVPVELHLLAKGGHGYGMRSGIAAAEIWPSLAEKWIHNVINPK